MERSELPSGILTILFAHVKDSTMLLQDREQS